MVQTAIFLAGFESESGWNESEAVRRMRSRYQAVSLSPAPIKSWTRQTGATATIACRSR